MCKTRKIDIKTKKETATTINHLALCCIVLYNATQCCAMQCYCCSCSTAAAVAAACAAALLLLLFDDDDAARRDTVTAAATSVSRCRIRAAVVIVGTLSSSKQRFEQKVSTTEKMRHIGIIFVCGRCIDPRRLLEAPVTRKTTSRTSRLTFVTVLVFFLICRLIVAAV